MNRTCSPARVGAQQNGPARQCSEGSIGANRTSRQFSAVSVFARARTVRASPLRLARTVTSHPNHSGDRGDRPVGNLAGDDRAELGRTVAELDSRLHPLRAGGVDEHAGLVELLGVVEDERHLDGHSVGEVDEQAVPVVVHEAVRGRAPQVACLGAGDEEAGSVRADVDGFVQPRAGIPRDVLDGRCHALRVGRIESGRAESEGWGVDVVSAALGGSPGAAAVGVALDDVPVRMGFELVVSNTQGSEVVGAGLAAVVP